MTWLASSSVRRQGAPYELSLIVLIPVMLSNMKSKKEKSERTTISRQGSQYFSLKLHPAMRRNSQASCKFTVKRLTATKCCEQCRPRCPTQLLPSYFSCAMKPENCPTSILAGAKAIPCHTC